MYWRIFKWIPKRFINIFRFLLIPKKYLINITLWNSWKWNTYTILRSDLQMSFLADFRSLNFMMLVVIFTPNISKTLRCPKHFSWKFAFYCQHFYCLLCQLTRHKSWWILSLRRMGDFRKHSHTHSHTRSNRAWLCVSVVLCIGMGTRVFISERAKKYAMRTVSLVLRVCDSVSDWRWLGGWWLMVDGW